MADEPNVTREPKVMRAYSTLEIKAVKDEGSSRKFSGIASTPSVDRMGDIVMPKGAEFQLPIPLLWQHDSHDPVGWVTSAKVTDKGIQIEGEVAAVESPASLRDRLETAWAMLKNKLVRGLSIGFKPLEFEPLDPKEPFGGLRFTKWSWLELSAVTIPANADASIQSIRSIAMGEIRRSAPGASGEERPPVRLDSLPGGSGRSTSSIRKGNEMKIAEQLAAFDTRRKAAVEKMQSVMQASADEGRALTEAEAQEYDGAKADIKQIDEHMERLKDFEASMVAKAEPVQPDAGRPVEGASYDIGERSIVSVKRNLAKGTGFTRYVMSLAHAKGNLMQAEVISRRWKDTPEVNLVLRAAVNAGTTTDSSWAGPLVQYQDLVSEFIDLLRNETILGRMNAVRRIPFNVRIPRQTSGSTGSFVGEGSPTPVREAAFDNITAPWAKASAIIVVTSELARMSNPAAEGLVRSDLVAGVSEFLDKRLVDPVYPGVANVSPASLTYGVTARQASGATLAALDADVAYLMQQFASANLGLGSGMWLMSPSLAITLSMLRTTQDALAFPGMSMNGGTFYGLPAITSNSVAPSGSPGDQHLILVNQNEVLVADDGEMVVDASMEASLELNDAPSGGATSLVSLWQNGLMGVKVDRWIYWTTRRSGVVQFIDAAQRYGS